MDKRNWKIYFEWIEGKDYKVLAHEFNLAQSTIKEICTSKISDKIKHTPWQTANQYKKWREFKRKQLIEQREGMSTPDTSTVQSCTE